jgi:uncharacterized protein (DUF1501 family)
MRLTHWLPRLAFADAADSARDTLIVVFLRGAADALNMIVPHGDADYYALRPTLAIAQPDRGSVAPSQRTIDLDGFFGLHPAMRALVPAWQDGAFAAVHACGAPDESRSHFQAMALMERGVADARGPGTGWLGRHLSTTRSALLAPLRAVAIGALAPRSLYGDVPVSALRSIADAHLGGPDRASRAQHLQRALGASYSGDDALSRNGRSTLAALRALARIDPNAQPASSIRYADTEFGHGLRQAALLIKAHIGVEVIALDHGGWDTHIAQGGADGQMAALLRELSDGMAALHADLHAHWRKVTVVCMSEFGRRASENGALGTDHGHAGALLALGGGVAGRAVYGAWPGLRRDALVGAGDLASTTDYRDVLSELLVKRLRTPDIGTVLPGHTPRALDMFRAHGAA